VEDPLSDNEEEEVTLIQKKFQTREKEVRAKEAKRTRKKTIIGT